MFARRIVSSGLIFFLLAAILPDIASAHGGVVEEDDLCVIKVNYLRAHFKIYQPRAAGHKQYCEDLPVAAESVFVMEYEHDSLSIMPIEFRIVRDVTGKGRFARLEDIEAIDDLDAVTVFHRAAVVEPHIYLANYEFKDEGEFIGIVSAEHPETGKLYTAVFPFEVGFTGLGYWPYILGMLLFIQFQYLLMSGRLKRWFGSSAAIVVMALLLAPDANAEDLVVSWTNVDGEPEINRMQQWVLHIEDEHGEGIEGAIIALQGGMPEHDHGLATLPRVTEDLGGGDYLIEGLRFHMPGLWEIEFTITTDNGVHTVVISLHL